MNFKPDSFKKGPLLYEGKGKRVFQIIGHDDILFLEFKDQLTAFNAQKKGEFAHKGEFNCKIASLIFRFLNQRGIKNHWVSDVSATEMIVKKMQMVPLEVVVRNFIAGSLAKKFNMPEGEKLRRPLVEFFFKNDELGDPFINDDQALMLNTVKDQKDLQLLRQEGLKVNDALIELMNGIAINLVDFKLEFGFDTSGTLLLGDEITPDSCRLWDKKTDEKLDKDRFRRDLGRVKESYEEVLNRLTNVWGSKV